MPNQVDAVRALQQIDRPLQFPFIDISDQLLQRGKVVRHKVNEVSFCTTLARLGQSGLHLLCACLEPRRRRIQALPENALQFLETLVPEMLRKPDEARRMHPLLLGNRVYRIHRHIVRILRQINRNLLVGLAQVVVLRVDLGDECLKALGLFGLCGLHTLRLHANNFQIAHQILCNFCCDDARAHSAIGKGE